MKKWYGIFAIVFTFSLLLIGCGDNSSNESNNNNNGDSSESSHTAFEGKYIADIDYLKNNYDKENVIVIDARGKDAAEKGTVEGAVAFVWQDLANVSEGKSGDEMWGTMKDAESLSETLASHGISKEKEILIFAEGNTGWGDEGRILWTLLAAGYDHVKMLDSGFDKIASADVSTVDGATELESVEVVISELDTSRIINTDELRANYDDYIVLDVRAEDEYNGATLYGEANGGHLPGAVHINYADFFHENNTLKSNDELEKLFTDAGLSKDDKIVAYCTAGIRSAHAQLVLEMLGFENSQNYDESFYRWAAIEELE